MKTEAGPDNFAEAVCSDGRLYVIRPLEWTLDKIQEVWNRWKDFEIFSDDLPATVDGFAYFVSAGGSIWFEILNDQDEQVGLVYLNDLIPSVTSGRFVSALFHATMWDAKVGPRIDLARAFLVRAVQVFGFHRIQAEIPLRFGGAIRVMKKIGFKEEGLLRQARRYHQEWYNVLVLGLLESEIEPWAIRSSQARSTLQETT